MMGHFCFRVQCSGTKTWYLYSVPASETVRSRKPVSIFFARAGLTVSTAPMNANTNSDTRHLRGMYTSHLQARNCNTTAAKGSSALKSAWCAPNSGEEHPTVRCVILRVLHFHSGTT